MDQKLMPRLIRRRKFQILLIIAIPITFLLMIAMGASAHVLQDPLSAQETIPTITPEETDIELTPQPEEFSDANRELTNGIVFGGIILVLIVVGSTLSIISRKDNIEEEPGTDSD